MALPTAVWADSSHLKHQHVEIETELRLLVLHLQVIDGRGQRVGRAPAVGVQVDGAVRVEADPFTAEALLHHGGRFEEAGTGEGSVAVHDAVAGQSASNGGVQRPPDGAGRRPGADVLGDVAVGRNPAGGNLGEHLPDAMVEAIDQGARNEKFVFLQ